MLSRVNKLAGKFSVWETQANLAVFRTHTLYQGVGVISTISSTLAYTNVKFCKVLEIPFKVSENTRSVKNLLCGYHDNCF